MESRDDAGAEREGGPARAADAAGASPSETERAADEPVVEGASGTAVTAPSGHDASGSSTLAGTSSGGTEARGVAA
ncbi:MAG: hypothetical protein K0S40_866, partial [Actinomycetospora sp.]|nr:hypothetical protein [Actinomycetospora sp.]